MRSVQKFLVVVAALVLPAISFSQEPGSNPDVPVNVQGVPFDNLMNIALLVAGVVFAIVKLRKRVQQQKKSISIQFQ